MLRPIGDYVLVELEDEAERTPGGIVLPEALEERNKPRAQWGRVEAVGPGRISRKGVLIAPQVEPGERVCFDRFRGTEMVVNGKRLLLLRGQDVLAAGA